MQALEGLLDTRLSPTDTPAVLRRERGGCNEDSGVYLVHRKDKSLPIHVHRSNSWTLPCGPAPCQYKDISNICL